MAQYPGAGGGDPLTGPSGGASSDEVLNQLLAGALAGGGSAQQAQTNPFAGPLSGQRVYMGQREADSGPTTFTLPSGELVQRGVGAGGVEDWNMDYDRAILQPLQWNDDKRRQFVNQGVLNHVPGFDVNMGMPEIQAAWQALVETSMLYNSQAKGDEKKWTPFDVLSTYENASGRYGTVREGDWVYDVATGERIRYVGPKTKTTTSRDVDLSSPEDVNALVLQSLRELLGRAPNDKELAQFRSSINSLERGRPTVTTTVQQLQPDLETGEVNVTSQDTTTKGGVSDTARAMLVQEDVIGGKEYAKYQSGTTYFNAMMQMLSGG